LYDNFYRMGSATPLALAEVIAGKRRRKPATRLTLTVAI